MINYMAKLTSCFLKQYIADWILFLIQIVSTMSMLLYTETLGVERRVVTAPSHLIYDSRQKEFRFGLAVPGEMCLLPHEEKEAWGKVIAEMYEPARNLQAKTLLTKICGRWMGYFCDEETRRCECLGDEVTWEREPIETQGCHSLIGSRCTSNLYCVNGAECSTSLQAKSLNDSTSIRRRRKRESKEDQNKPATQAKGTELGSDLTTENTGVSEPAQNRKVEGTCVCVHPGFRNCSRFKEMAYDVGSGGLGSWTNKLFVPSNVVLIGVHFLLNFF